MDDYEAFKKIHMGDLVMDSTGRAGIPFDILKKDFGFIITVKGNEIYIKQEQAVIDEMEDTESRTGDLVSTDDFKIDFKMLRKFYGFKKYYQDSIIFNSENRGINRYDIIISATDEWYNLTIKGDYRTSCDISNDKNIIPKIIKYYFPLSSDDIVAAILERDSYRNIIDERDVLIRTFDQETKEMVFSKKGSKL